MSETQGLPKLRQSNFDYLRKTVGPYIMLRKKTGKAKSFCQQESVRSSLRGFEMDVAVGDNPDVGPLGPHCPFDVTKLHPLNPPTRENPSIPEVLEPIPKISMDDHEPVQTTQQVPTKSTEPSEDTPEAADSHKENLHVASPSPYYMTPKSSPKEVTFLSDPDTSRSVDEASSMSMVDFPSLRQYPVHTSIPEELLHAVAKCCQVPGPQVTTFVGAMKPIIIPDDNDLDKHVLGFHLNTNPVFHHMKEIPFFNIRPEALWSQEDIPDNLRELR